MKNEFLAHLKQGAPLLVASLDGDDLAYLLEQARVERADVVELRMDVWGAFFREEMLEKMTRFKQKIGIPMLVTFRGGHPFPSWWQPVHWRALSQAAMMDVEWNPKYPWKEISKNARRYNVALMISHHDYAATPREAVLVKFARAAYAKKADIVKLATRVNSEEELRTLLAVSRRFAPKKWMTVMGMGPYGALSRMIAPLYHSCLVYGYIGTATATGQLPYPELQERIRTLYPSYNQALQKRQARQLEDSLA